MSLKNRMAHNTCLGMLRCEICKKILNFVINETINRFISWQNVIRNEDAEDQKKDQLKGKINYWLRKYRSKYVV